MALRFASWEENGKIVHGLIEKTCDYSCPCEKATEKGIDNPAALSLSDLSPNCTLQRIPHLIERSLLPQIRNRIEALSTADFEAYCKEQQQFHLSKVDEHIRFLANPDKRFCRKVLTDKLWNQQAIKVYSQALAANAIDGNTMISINAIEREQKVKRLSDALQNGFDTKKLTALIDFIEPNWKILNEADKSKKQTSLAGVWKRAFPLAALALTEREYLAHDISYRAISQLFSKHFGLPDLIKTFQNWMKPDQVSEPNYLERANTWLDKHA